MFLILSLLRTIFQDRMNSAVRAPSALALRRQR
jgi:hypothetical protein